MSISDVPAGSAVVHKRDDGSGRTLLRVRPTNSRSDDAFVTPKTFLSSDDRLVLLQTTCAEGTAFALVKTKHGVQGYVQSQHILIDSSFSAHFHAYAHAIPDYLGVFVDQAEFDHLLSMLALSAIANTGHPHVTLWHSKRDHASSFAFL